MPSHHPLTRPRARRTRRARRAALAFLAGPVCAVAIAGCGGSQTGSTNSTTNAPTFTLIATDIKWDQPGYAAKAGKNTIGLRNQGSISHSLVVKDASGNLLAKRILIAPGRSGSVEVDVAAGTYTLLCDVPGHEATMHAQLTVS